MKVLGIVSEYNPFHNGHKYHIEQSKRISASEYAVCVMSGNFIQRGEPAIMNKWARAKAALLSGIDLAIELPVVYSMASAEFFAYGAVKILDSLGIVDYISFGSENGRLDELKVVAEVLSNEPEAYKEFLKKYLDKGLSYPASRESALKEYLQPSYSTLDISKAIGSSNNILGIEYLKALKKLGSKISPMTLERVCNNYNEANLTGNISSATSVRKDILSRANEDILSGIKDTLPTESYKVLKEELENKRGPVSSSNFENMLFYAIRSGLLENIKKVPYVAEGLENRIKSTAMETGSIEELIDGICTKRYTRTRIQRALFHILTGLTGDELDTFNLHGGPQYIRILGFNHNGRKLLTEIKKKASLPVIMKTADFKDSCNPLLRRMLELEAMATDIYVLAYENKEFRQSGQEFTQKVVKV